MRRQSRTVGDFSAAVLPRCCCAAVGQDSRPGTSRVFLYGAGTFDTGVDGAYANYLSYAAVNPGPTRASARRCCARGRPGTRAATSSAGSTQALNSILTTNVGGGPIDQDVFDEAAREVGRVFSAVMASCLTRSAPSSRGPTTATSRRCCPTGRRTPSRSGSGSRARRSSSSPRRRSQKARNLERDPRVAISMVDHDDPYLTARIRGRVTRTTTGDEAWEVIDRLARPLHGRAVPVPPADLDRLLRRAAQGRLDAAAVPASPGRRRDRPQGGAARPHRGRRDPRARAADRRPQRPARPRRRDRRRRALRAGATSSTSSTPTTAPRASSGPARTTATSSTSTS